jgi:hypothetical protein
MKIYVSGPFSTDPDGILHNDSQLMEANKRIAKEIGIQLAKMGHEPYVPHTHLGGWENALSYDEIMRTHLTFVRDWADAIFFIGPSKGAIIEKNEAEMLGIPVFRSFEEIQRFGEIISFQKLSPCRLNTQQQLLAQLQ